MKLKITLGNTIYSEKFIKRKVIDAGTFLMSLIFLGIIYMYQQVLDDLDVVIIYYAAFYVLFPLSTAFFLWDLLTTKVEIRENGIYSNYSLKYRGIWHFKEIEDILLKPFPYGKNMKQIALLLKSGEEKTIMAYDRDMVINKVYQEAKMTFEGYKAKTEGKYE